MKYFKSIVPTICLAAATVFSQQTQAQFMPVVFDNNYGKANQFSTVTADFPQGDVVVAGVNGGAATLTWLDREGAARFSQRFTPTEFSEITGITPVGDESVLVFGRRALAKKDATGGGRAMLVDSKGTVKRSVVVGGAGAVVTGGSVSSGGNIFLAGSDTAADGPRGMICKVSPSGKVIYTYLSQKGSECSSFNIHGSRQEYVNAAFTSSDGKGSSVVRIDDGGKPFFITEIPEAGFHVEKMIAGLEGDLFLVGQGPQSGGQVVKIREEGDIVFQRAIIPASTETRLFHLEMSPSGELLVGGNDSSAAYFSLLRGDGTVISKNTAEGVVSTVKVNPASGECLVSTFDPSEGRGRVVNMTRQGYRLYDKATAANYTSMFVNTNGDVLLGSAQTGRLSMLSPLGDLLFDRYVVENTPTAFARVALPSTGEAIFVDGGSRIAKLAHGVYVSDISVKEPMGGHVSAIFTVVVSGYSFSPEGSPVPVSVAYKTRPETASEGVNFDPVEGTISFVPSTDGSDRYLNKFTVEVPVHANDLLEGARTFTLDLSNVRGSYLVKSSSTATIEDQPALVKAIGVTPGIEGEKDIVYTLGLFKRDGTPLVNKTRADIVVDGVYGVGTADALDFNTHRVPRLSIASGSHSGDFNVETLEDTRYESTKDVVLNFTKVHAMSDTDVSFGASSLSCSGDLHDQAALVAIESLGDHTRRTNDVVQGLFKVSLVSARSGRLLTNNSGSDISITAPISDESSARSGEDFVVTNAHALKIAGDGRSSTVNLNGLVLHSTEAEPKIVVMKLHEVKAGANAGPLGIASDRDKARFTIRAN